MQKRQASHKTNKGLRNAELPLSRHPFSTGGEVHADGATHHHHLKHPDAAKSRSRVPQPRTILTQRLRNSPWESRSAATGDVRSFDSTHQLHLSTQMLRNSSRARTSPLFSPQMLRNSSGERDGRRHPDAAKAADYDQYPRV